MAFSQAHKNQGGGVSINPRTVLRTDRPLSANSITSKNVTCVAGAVASAPQRTKSSNSPSTNISSIVASRRHSNGSSKCHDGGGITLFCTKNSMFLHFLPAPVFRNMLKVLSCIAEA